ncbi:Bardet-Biedl syndrome 12 protein [Trichomycterus rosablanca]|uniref:Bardet-Biedl syndrome 12 protein n=1 Tax=Trichomycterus rosablanca TaxID=2290929 RepID=UPI002F35A61E
MAHVRSTAINQGRHIGLQQLEALSAASYSFLGPNKRYKFIQDEADAEAALVRSSYRMLEQLELSVSVAQLLYETTHAHWKVLRTGTNTLTFLTCVWSRVALECLHRGIAIPYIVAGMSKGLDLCVEACRQRAVSVEIVCKAVKQNLELSRGNGMKEDTGAPQDGVQTMNNEHLLKHRLKLKHSRHFNSKDETKVFGTQKEERLKDFDIAHLAEAVSHGCELSFNLVIEASKIQSKQSKADQSEGQHKTILHVDHLVTCSLAGIPEEHSCVHRGYVVLLSSEQALLLKSLSERMLKISLVNGDLSERHRHVGFNRPKNVTFYSDQPNLTGISREQEWMDCALKILLKLKIDIVLISGTVTQQLKDHCFTQHILVIEHIRLPILTDFARTTGALPVSYVTQLNERCVGTGVRVNTLREYYDNGKTQSTVVNVVAEGTALVTALITSSVHAKLQSLEDQFWSCAYRVHHALKEGKLLPGAGATELLCIHQLQKHMDIIQTQTVKPYEQVVLQLMTETWMDYISTLMVNAGQVEAKAQAWTRIAQSLKDWESKGSRTESPETPLKMMNCSEVTQKEISGGSDVESMVEKESVTVGVYDNMTVKFEAWRRALDLVLLVLLTDTEIITGVNNTDDRYKDFIIL